MIQALWVLDVLSCGHSVPAWHRFPSAFSSFNTGLTAFVPTPRAFAMSPHRQPGWSWTYWSTSVQLAAGARTALELALLAFTFA